MLITEKEVLFVQATRIQGTNDKGRDYDFANVEVSDGIGSLELPITPALAELCNERFARGEKVFLHVNVHKAFGRTQFIVDDVQPAVK